MGLGLLLLIVPGLYLAVSGGLFSLVVMYEGRGGIGRSFALVHSGFGAALGRFGLLALFLLVSSCVVGCFLRLFTSTTIVVRLMGEAVNSLADVLILTVVLVGLLLTYTQLRARRSGSPPTSWCRPSAGTPAPIRRGSRRSEPDHIRLRFPERCACCGGGAHPGRGAGPADQLALDSREC